ncbi:MAG TPA: sensor histidine kinase [Actinomycetota bacterium]|nr:sensor histidine kinase [Actinomycetota bacterium]
MRGSRLAIGLGGLVVVLCLVGVGLVLVRGEQGHSMLLLALALAISAYGAVGALIASQVPRNPVGWLVASGALAVAQFLFAEGISAGPGSPTGWSRPLAWLIVLVLPVAPACLILALLYFPDGRLANRWFRPVVWAVVGGSLLLFLSLLAHPEEFGSEAGLRGLDWALGLPLVDSYVGIWGMSMLLGSMAVLASLLVRSRRGSEEDRRPLRWLLRMLLALVALVAVGFGGGALLVAVTGDANDAWFAFMFVFLGGAAIVLFGIPMALTVGVLRYRVYEIDLTIRKTIVGRVMVAYVVLAFVFIASAPLSLSGASLDLSRRLPAWIVIPILFLGMSFGPVRRWARRGADRILYGARATPYEVLSEFGERVGETYSTEDVLPRMAQLLAAGTGASEARVWLRVGRELQDVARWPEGTTEAEARLMAGSDLPSLPDGETFAVVHQGEMLGALAITVPLNDPMNPAKDRLARDLASQAGLVLRNVRLIEELRASRQRLVAAQDHERRRLERNIHDGAQQQLVAIAVKLKLADALVGKDEGRAHAMLAGLQAEANEALEDLRDLARGIYPPLLADQGLEAALDAQARRSPVAVSVEPDGIGRYPQEVEAAVYFCCLEALQNIAKYAEASEVTVRLEQRDSRLLFSVRDDGAGFDPIGVKEGSGLTNMRDRLEALGGALEVTSSAGSGTTISGLIPVAAT